MKKLLYGFNVLVGYVTCFIAGFISRDSNVETVLLLLALGAVNILLGQLGLERERKNEKVA